MNSIMFLVLIFFCVVTYLTIGLLLIKTRMIFLYSFVDWILRFVGYGKWVIEKDKRGKEHFVNLDGSVSFYDDDMKIVRIIFIFIWPLMFGLFLILRVILWVSLALIAFVIGQASERIYRKITQFWKWAINN